MLIVFGIVLFLMGVMGVSCVLIEYQVAVNSELMAETVLTYFDYYQVLADRIDKLFYFCLTVGIVGLIIIVLVLIGKFLPDRIKCTQCGRWYDLRYLSCPHCMTLNPTRILNGPYSKKE